MGDEEVSSKPKSNGMFNRKLGEIPCFRQSMITGIISGMSIGIVYFMAKSKVTTATHVAMGSFTMVTLGTWFVCRYQWSAERFKQRQINRALQSKIFYEGTEVEKQILSLADDT